MCPGDRLEHERATLAVPDERCAELATGRGALNAEAEFFGQFNHRSRLGFTGTHTDTFAAPLQGVQARELRPRTTAPDARAPQASARGGWG